MLVMYLLTNPVLHNAPSIFTLSVSAWLLVPFGFCTFLLRRNMQTSSPMGYRLQSLQNFAPVSTFFLVASPVETAGVC